MRTIESADVSRASPAAARSGQRAAAIRGFTLVEMMIVIVIIGFLAVLSGPAYREFIASQRIKTTAFELFADLNYARSEAIKVNAEVIIAKAAGGWANGWTVTQLDGGGITRTLRAHGPLDAGLTLTGSLDQVKFQRNGRPLIGTAAASFTLGTSPANAAISSRCIVVDPGGRSNSTTGACS